MYKVFKEDDELKQYVLQHHHPPVSQCELSEVGMYVGIAGIRSRRVDLHPSLIDVSPPHSKCH